MFPDDFTSQAESDTQVKREEKYENDLLKLEDGTGKGPSKVKLLLTWI